MDFSIEIERPAEDVFAFVSNLENDPLWQSTVRRATKLTGGPIGKGSRFRHVFDFAGHRLNVEGEIFEFTPHRTYALRSLNGPIGFEVRVACHRAAANATRVDTIVEAYPTGVFRLGAVMLSRRRSREIAGDLEKLKRLMESNRT